MAIAGALLVSGVLPGVAWAQESVPKVECSSEHPCFRYVGPGSVTNTVTQRCTETTIQRSIVGGNGPRQESIPQLDCTLPGR